MSHFSLFAGEEVDVVGVGGDSDAFAGYGASAGGYFQAQQRCVTAVDAYAARTRVPT